MIETKKLNEVYDERTEENNEVNILPPEYALNADFSTLFEALKTQLDSIEVPSVQEDKLSPIISMLHPMLQNMHDADARVYVQDGLTQVYQLVDSIITEFIGVPPESNAFNTIRDLPGTEYQNFIESLYKFFIPDRIENISCCIYNSILRHSKEFANNYREFVDRKDIVTKSEKKKIRDRDGYIILDKLGNIIADIIVGDMSDDILEMISKDREDEFEIAILLEAFEGVNIPNLKKGLVGNILENEEALRLVTIKVYSKLMSYYFNK